MKTVVVEIKDDLAIILSDDGCITSIKNKNYTIGQIVMVEDNAISATKKGRISSWVAAAAAVIMLTLGGSAYAYYTPYSYITLDVNPSVEYVLNRFDRVLEIKAVNDDGYELIKKAQLKSLTHKSIETAFYETVKQITEEGFFDGNEGGIVITTSGKNDKYSEKLAKNLQEYAEEVTEDKNVAVESVSIGKERVEEARALGVTPGKLNLVQKLQASLDDPEDIDIEEWLEKPVKEIMKEIKHNREARKAADDELNDEKKADKAVKKLQEKELKAEEKADKDAEKLKEKELKAKEKADKDAQKLKEKELKDKEKADKDAQKLKEKELKNKEKADKDAQKLKEKEQKNKEKANKASEKLKEKE